MRRRQSANETAGPQIRLDPLHVRHCGIKRFAADGPEHPPEELPERVNVAF